MYKYCHHYCHHFGDRKKTQLCPSSASSRLAHGCELLPGSMADCNIYVLASQSELHKTSTTKLSSISCLIWSPHGNIWQHSKDSKVPRPEPTRTGLQQGLPHILAGVPGLCRVASCDDGYESRTNVKKNNVVNKDLPRCSKMFQLSQKDVWISGHLFQMNFRWSLLHVSYTSPSRENMGNEDRCHRSLSQAHGCCGSPGHQIPYFDSELPKKTIDPLVKMVSKIRHLVWSSL